MRVYAEENQVDKSVTLALSVATEGKLLNQWFELALDCESAEVFMNAVNLGNYKLLKKTIVGKDIMIKRLMRKHEPFCVQTSKLNAIATLVYSLLQGSGVKPCRNCESFSCFS